MIPSPALSSAPPSWTAGVPLHPLERDGRTVWRTGRPSLRPVFLAVAALAGVSLLGSTLGLPDLLRDVLRGLTVCGILYAAFCYYGRVELDGSVLRYADVSVGTRLGTPVREVDLAQVVAVHVEGSDPWAARYPDRVLNRVVFVGPAGPLAPSSSTWASLGGRSLAVAALVHLRRSGVPVAVPDEVLSLLARRLGLPLS